MPDGDRHDKVIQYVSEVERTQSDVFERFLKLQYLYDPNDRSWTRSGVAEVNAHNNVIENLVAANIDSVTAIIAATEVRPRFMTDDGDWSTQRTARHMEFYAEGLCKKLKVHEHARRGFKDGSLKGIGLAKVYIDGFNKPRVERTMVDDIVVDEAEARNGRPLQMHHRMFIDREELLAQFPDNEDDIRRAQTGRSRDWRYWADYRPIERNEIVVIESWRLPIGTEDDDGYVPGRHCITIDGCDLVDEPYHKAYFPFARFAWSERTTGWYAIGLAERIAGHQRGINKLNWQIDRQLDQHAVPTTYVRMADANMAVKGISRAGTVVPVKAEYPQTVIPRAVSPEQYQRRHELKESAFEESGQSRMAAQAKKPAGVDSGVALREYRDQTSQRFAMQEKAYEQFVLDIVWLLMACCKELGKDAPVVLRKARWGKKKIKWSDVDLGEVEIQLTAASALPRTPAGRMQTVIEWAQAGVISQDEARRLLQHPDLEHAMSLYNAAREDIEQAVEAMLDGEVVFPEPFQNLKMGLWLIQQAYLKAGEDGAPEEILETLRQWLVQAAYTLSLAEMPSPEMSPTLQGSGVQPAGLVGQAVA